MDAPAPPLRRILRWLAAAALTVATFSFQDRTGPTQPLAGEVPTAAGPVRFLFLRSENVGTDLQVMLLAPVPPGISAVVRYRRFKSHDAWRDLQLAQGTFTFERRGERSRVQGLGAALPSLRERAGKYEFFVLVDDGAGPPRSVTGDRAVIARYKGAVPTPVLLTHIAVVFLSMALALRTGLAALAREPHRRLTLATVVTLVAGAFVLGPLVQRYAFGVWWSGVPFGWDWTDNKVLVALAAWLGAAWANRGGRTSRGAILAATLVTVAVFLIPHSIFGSEYDYTRGAGRGTAG